MFSNNNRNFKILKLYKEASNIAFGRANNLKVFNLADNPDWHVLWKKLQVFTFKVEFLY